MLKELIADVKRWVEDRKTNSIYSNRVTAQGDSVPVFTKDVIEGDGPQILTERVRSDQIKVGDILMLRDEDLVPADCLLLYTKDLYSECFV